MQLIFSDTLTIKLVYGLFPLIMPCRFVLQGNCAGKKYPKVGNQDYMQSELSNCARGSKQLVLLSVYVLNMIKFGTNLYIHLFNTRNKSKNIFKSVTTAQK